MTSLSFGTFQFCTDCLHPPTKIPVPNDYLSYFFKCTHDVIQVNKNMMHAVKKHMYTTR